jgi:hypothetical protein
MMNLKATGKKRGIQTFPTISNLKKMETPISHRQKEKNS